MQIWEKQIRKPLLLCVFLEELCNSKYQPKPTYVPKFGKRQ